MPYYGILTAANPKGDLTYLEKEFQQLNEYFKPLKATVNTTINNNATERAVFEDFLSETDIRIFHFSGHAGSGKILMDDGRLSEGNVLAGIIRYAKNLKLVFLNGCATYDLVDKFLEYGASLVIATNAPVYDSIACEFSSFFYEGLCRKIDMMSIGQAFDAARQRIMVSIQKKMQESAPDKQKGETEEQYKERVTDNEKYKKMLGQFEKEDTARTILKEPQARPAIFQWAIYHNKKNTEAQRQSIEAWKLIDRVASEPFQHREPSFDFLKCLVESVTEIAKENHEKDDPRNEIFTRIAGKKDLIGAWSGGGMNDLITDLGNTLFLPLKKPYNDLINHCNTNTRSFDRDSESDYINLLQFQINLYTSFIRTAAAIMISCFTEALMNVISKGDENLQKDFRDVLRDNAVLTTCFKELIAGTTGLDNLEFAINMARSIVVCLAEAKDRAKGEDKTLFEQFVKEYNGNAVGTVNDIGIVNSVHETLLNFKKKLDKEDIRQADINTLRIYCDKSETALMELFNQHRYVLMYEVITVVKVEANRQRYKPVRTINHELITTIGFFVSMETEYGKEFAENYSVLLVSHRNNYLKYISLSPFIINVSPFLQEEKSMFYYYTGKKSDYIYFTELDEKADPNVQVHATKQTEDASFISFNKNVNYVYQKRDNGQARRTRVRFARVRDQYIFWENAILGLINKTGQNTTQEFSKS